MNTSTPQSSTVSAEPKTKLTDKQYQILLDLFNELNEDFFRISLSTISAFYDRLYDKSN